MNDLISVIIPIYKVEKYLEKCIDSVLSQTYQNLEIILVDDGSTDRCPAICDEYALKDKRIKVIHQENAGLSEARNAGIRNASGKYIAFLDSDDYIEAEMYEKMLSLITDENADLAICNVVRRDEFGYPIRDMGSKNVFNVVYDREEILKKLVKPNSVYYITAWNKLYKRNLFEHIQFPKGKIHEDEFIIHEIFDICEKVVTTEDVYYNYVQRENSIMSQRVTVKRFHQVEALYKRFLFYKEKTELSDCLHEIANTLCDAYIHVLRGLSVCKIDDLWYWHSIKHVYREVLSYLLKGSLSTKKRIKYMFPEPYVFVTRMKSSLKGKLRCLKAVTKMALHIGKSDYILLDTPEHGNLGDHAIALAEQQVLKTVGISYVEITAGELNNLEKLYSKLTPMNHYIVIHGGGFLGALWPAEEYRFRRILKAFKNHRIIVFPQTVTFDMNSDEGKAFFNESKQIYSSHKNLTICVREKMSLEFMNKYMPAVNVILVPDIVTLLNAESGIYDRRGILLCMRADKEKVLSAADMTSILKTIGVYYPVEEVVYTDTVINKRIEPAERKSEVNKKLDEFSKSRLVITDRLHGMIFAAITGTPCIAFGNSNGKVKAVYEWIKELPYIYFVNSVSEMDNVIQKIHIDMQYTYDRKIIDGKFEKLYELLLKKKV